jgi:hypothetical protein
MSGSYGNLRGGLRGGLGLLCTLVLAVPVCPQAVTLDHNRHHWAVENLDRNAVDQRGVTTSPRTAFDRLVLRANTRYRFWLLSGVTLKIGKVDATTADPGTTYQIPPITLRERPAFDKDGEGLSDLAEMIVGTDASDPDTDDDGVSDLSEVLFATEAATPDARTGVIASIALPGRAVDLCAMADLLVVAHENGITGLNVFSGLNPQVVLRLTPEGGATRVACSARRLAIASGASGLSLVDATDPPAARVEQVVPPSLLEGVPVSVAAAADVAYAGLENGRIAAVDMVLGGVIERLRLFPPGGPAERVGDVAIAGGVLYAVAGDVLHALPLDGGGLRVSGSARIPSGTAGGLLRLAVGRGEAFAVFNRGPSLEAPRGGYARFDLSDPLRPVFAAETTSGEIGWRDLALNGTGLAVACVAVTSGGPADLVIYDVLTDQRGDGSPTPGSAEAIEIANALAYVADGESGLQVVGYLPLRNTRVPPAITLLPGFDPAGVEEGKRVLVQAAVTVPDPRNVQARNVEFVINGATTSDPTFPFELQFVTPRIADGPTFTVRARVFDTAGNSAWSEEITARLVADRTPPRITRGVPQGGVIGPVRAVVAYADELLDPATVTPATFTLVSAGTDLRNAADDVAVVAQSVEFRAEARAAFFLPDADLVTGVHRARVTGAVADLAGTRAGRDFTFGFRVWENVDANGDGVLDGGEDPDGDGLVNAFEAVLGRNFQIPDFDPQSDADGDGLTDLMELELGTDPFSTDTDGDGFLDSEEVVALARVSDPLDPESVPLSTSAQQVTVFNRGNTGFAIQQVTVFNRGNTGFAIQQVLVENQGNPP